MENIDTKTESLNETIRMVQRIAKKLKHCVCNLKLPCPCPAFKTTKRCLCAEKEHLLKINKEYKIPEKW